MFWCIHRKKLSNVRWPWLSDHLCRNALTCHCLTPAHTHTHPPTVRDATLQDVLQLKIATKMYNRPRKQSPACLTLELSAQL